MAIMKSSEFSAKPLQDLHLLLNCVYVPLLESKQDMRGTVHKFSTHLLHTSSQVVGSVSIQVPEFPPSMSVEEILAKRVKELDAVLEDWTNIAKDVLAKENARRVENDKSAMAEIDFWRNRNATLSALHQQFSLPKVRRILDVMEVARQNYESYSFENFQSEMMKLNKMHAVAKDNVKFLNTLERQFKILQGDDLLEIKETLPSMMNGLRLVWTISRHYKQDEMLNLMAAIAAEIAAKVESKIQVSKIFKLTPDEAITLIESGIEVLDKWFETYSKTRKEVDKNEARWPYDHRRLFEGTKQMTKVLQNLQFAAVCLKEFYSFLGDDLKKVTGDAEGIKEVIGLVDNLSKPLQEFTKVFSSANSKAWESRFSKFLDDVVEIEERTKDMVDRAFRELRSAEGAFDLIKNLKNIDTREPIKKHMQKKYTDILERYGEEIEQLHELTRINIDNPPITKGMPPVSGAVAWTESIFKRARRPLLKFMTHEGLMDRPEGKATRNQFFELGKKIRKKHHVELVEAWKNKCSNSAVESLAHNILMRSQKDGSYSVNFDSSLQMMIREAKYMKRNDLSNTVLNVALQERKYRKYVGELSSMLKEYNDAVGTLKPVERKLLRAQIEILNSELEPGCTSYNWHSLSIKTFIEKCRIAIKSFNSVKNQVQKHADSIEERIKTIEEAKLVRDFDWQRKPSDIMDIMEFYEYFESHRQTTVTELRAMYERIGYYLVEIEITTVETNTNAAESMLEYYHYWERRVFNAITKMIIKALLTLQALFTKKDKRPPLFKVKSVYNPPEVTYYPSQDDIGKLLQSITTNILDSAKVFIRWRDGRCDLCEPKIVNDEKVDNHTFYKDVSRIQSILTLQMVINDACSRLSDRLNKNSEYWKKNYDQKYKLWDEKTKSRVEKLGEKSTPFSSIESKMYLYDSLIKNLNEANPEKRALFVVIDNSPVQAAVIKQAKSWLKMLCEILNDMLTKNSKRISEEIDKFRADLTEQPNDIQGLKAFLSVIAQINGIHMTMEFRLSEVEEQVRTLRMYKRTLSGAFEEKMKFELDPQLAEVADNLRARWGDLRVEAIRKDWSILETKREFAEKTRKEVQIFQSEIRQVHGRYMSEGPGAETTPLKTGSDLLEHYKQEVASLNKRREDHVVAEQLLGLQISSFPELVEIEENNRNLDEIYRLYNEQQNSLEEWSLIPWASIDMNIIEKASEDYYRRMNKMSALYDALPAYAKLKEVIGGFKESVPLIKLMKSDFVRPRHWKELLKEIGWTKEVDFKNITLQDVFDMELHNHNDKVEEILGTASSESKIEKDLLSIETYWKITNFDIGRYKKGTEDKGIVLKSADTIKQDIEDNLNTLSQVQNSRHVAAFSTKVTFWERALNVVFECIDMWFMVQRKWQYLEGIFIGTEDIRVQLPDVAKRFDRIDKSFQKLMENTAKNPNVYTQCFQDASRAEERTKELEDIYKDLDGCQKKLSNYLDAKKNDFPRFFFISDDELLSILGSSDPEAIQPHMLKLYDNCKSLIFGRGNQIGGMVSEEGESFNFLTPVKPDGAVELWMNKVDEMMKETLQQITKEAVYYFSKTERIIWCKDQIGMVALAGSQIWWTWSVEDVFRRVKEGNKHAMKDEAAKETRELADLVSLVRQDIDRLTRKKINTQIIIDVHARDIVERFVRDSILDAREFEWESQLRFYWNRTIDDIQICQCTGKFRYGYEYEGLNGRLVITPLTDRCVMTLTTALTFNLGGSPAGPAGTGKTETVKDLAKSLAIRCVVNNCGDGLDSQAMGKIFSGLVQTGFWGCFDEFNRIKLKVLSVVSSQIRSVQYALNNGKSTLDMLGKEIPLVVTVGIFVTMNPGYEGRNELPDNLKALFRPVVMVVPDINLICENMLMSEGFNQSRILAKKMCVLYKLAKEQLSKQHHYDFGLRALKSVLVMAGSLKRGSPSLSEDMVLMRALRDMNLPKFVYEDVPLFLGLIQDLFPGLTCERVVFDDLKDEAVKFLTEKGFRHSDDDVFFRQIDKIMQLHETMLTRHTTMVVGPTGGGKSVVIEGLRAGLAEVEKGKVTIYTLNPKSMTNDELYGIQDPTTREWTDGLLSKIFRNINQTPIPEGKRERRWICFDGDVDALWVENMNSVMDDNKLLTLTNGERIRLEKHSAMLFEVYNIFTASAATVSRCGMVYVDDKDLGYRPFYERWANAKLSLGEGVPDALMFLFNRYVDKCVQRILEGVSNDEIVAPLVNSTPRTGLNMVKQLCTMLDVMIPRENTPQEADQLDNLYIFSVLWSLGGCLVEESRPKFEEFLRGLSDRLIPPLPLFDQYYDRDIRQWNSWEVRVRAKGFELPADRKFSKILVPTVDTERYSWLLSEVMKQESPCMFVGESGTAKSITIISFLNDLDNAAFQSLNINFSSRTRAADFQRTLDDKLEKRSGKNFGPPSGKLIIFVDDLNMPRVDKYGTQQPIALFKFLVEKGYYYNLLALEDKIVKDTLYIGAMQPPGGGRPQVDPRFMSLFTCFNVTFPSHANLTSIYTSILSKHLSEFPEALLQAADRITEATLKLYRDICEQLPRTPLKFHYIFNLRDLSRIYEGMYQSTVDKLTTVEQLIRLWRNECTRVFADRLINYADREKVTQDLLPRLITTYFKDQAEYALQDPLAFGDFSLTKPLDPENEDPRLYEDMQDFERVKKKFNEMLSDYNEEHRAMNLVLFNDAVDHLTRIHRILRMPRGNALLVGVGGSGKQSLTKLATFTAQHELFQITLTKSYKESNFKEDLKTLYSKLGSTAVVFLITDAHVKEEGFLEFINNMLTIGMVPALYAEDEKEGLTRPLEEEMKRSGETRLTKDVKWTYFVNKARDNLHVVLSMSPAGDTLRVRCRNFPGLVNNSSIDWFFTWPEEALLSVANHFLKNEDLPSDHRENIVKHIVQVHLSIFDYSLEFEQKLRRKNYSTPKNFLDFIAAYVKTLVKKRKDIDSKVLRYETGLIKIAEGAIKVESMSKELAISKVEVDKKKIEVEMLIENISSRSEQAMEHRKNAEETQIIVLEQTKIATEENEKAQTALIEAEPALEAARIALSVLDPRKLQEVKAYKTPSSLIQNICMSVLILKPLPNTPSESEGWSGCVSMLSNMDLLNQLRQYRGESVKSAMYKKITDMKKRMPELNDPELVKKGSSEAAANLWAFVEAMMKVYEINSSIEPLRKRVRDATYAVETGQKKLSEIEEQLSRLEVEISDLTQKRGVADAELSYLTKEKETMERRLNAASKLMEGLGNEQVRWTSQSLELKAAKERLVGDCLLAASFLCYTGPFNFEFRNRMIYEDWIGHIRELQIPLTDDFHLKKLMTSDVECSKWASEGLPQDDLSIQNGILTTNSTRWPLCIDPQEQAVAWIKEKEKSRTLTRRTLNDSNFAKDLEGAIRFGYSFLFENVDEEIDPMIDAVLEKSYTIQAGQKILMFGGAPIEWDDNFRLFLTSKLSNPHYSPEIMSKTSIINYTVTMQGLEDQLLNVIVSHDRADLEEERHRLVISLSDNQTKRSELEESLLRELNAAKGSILDNDELIKTLDDTKTRSDEIEKSIAESIETKADIDKARSAFQPAAMRGSILFFAMAGLSSISEMYEYSLAAYLRVFRQALSDARKDNMTMTRVKNIIEKLTMVAYNYTCLGIFEKHKLMFSFQMTVMIMDKDGDIDAAEYNFFIKGNTSLDAVTVRNPYGWFPEQGWKDLERLITVNQHFANLRDDIMQNPAVWKEWYDLETPERVGMPLGYDQLTLLQQLCILRVFRIDRVYNAIKKFVVEKHKSEHFVMPPPLNYEEIYKQTNNRSPVVFILSPGADPQSDVQRLADAKGFTGTKFKNCALGQGMDVIAIDYLKTGHARGHWVMLQNCHLLARFLKSLEKELEAIQKPHADFRLWLTTEPTDRFPLSILQQSLKVVTEPPDGLKQNMRGTYSKVTDEILDDCPHEAYRSLIYVLSFFHAVVQERRKYGKIGWNVSYDFNDSDFSISQRLLSMYLSKSLENHDENLPWGSLRYLIGEAMYGGRVTDDFDRRVLVTYLNEYVGEFLFDTNQPFFFSRNDEFQYKVPARGPLETYTQSIMELPLNNSPEVFGLHSNAEISYFTNASKSIWVNLIRMRSEGGASAGLNKEEYLQNLIQDLEHKIPGLYDVRNIAKDMGEIRTPTQIVLLQELERFNLLIDCMKTTLQNLASALRGEIGMSSDLDDLASSLFNGFLPRTWRDLTPKTEKPIGAWIEYFIRRNSQYKRWLEAEPPVMWISGLHIPESYLTALVQTTCRLKGWALDKSTLFTEVTQITRPEDIKTRLEHGCYITGLYLEGAKWNIERSCLERQDPKQLVLEMPVIKINPVETNKLKLRGTIKTPVYVTQERRNAAGVGLVMEADLATDEHASHWVLQGVALVLNVDY
jgi:dynein heavy chain